MMMVVVVVTVTVRRPWFCGLAHTRSTTLLLLLPLSRSLSNDGGHWCNIGAILVVDVDIYFDS